MLYQEATFHDRQCSLNENSQNTSSTSFVNITGATLTTKDLGSTGSYVIWFTVLISASLNNTTASFRLLEDGSPVGAELHITLRTKDLDIGYTLTEGIDSEANVVFQLQWKTDIGTLTLQEHNLTIDGIPSYRVVE